MDSSPDRIDLTRESGREEYYHECWNVALLLIKVRETIAWPVGFNFFDYTVTEELFSENCRVTINRQPTYALIIISMYHT